MPVLRLPLALPLLFLAALPAAAAAGAAEPVPAESPFAPPPPAAAAPAEEPVELRGITVMEKKIYVSLLDRAGKTSHWLPVGENVAGIEVVSCDVDAGRCVVRIAGQLKTLVLREPAVVAGAAAAPFPAPAGLEPSAAAAPDGPSGAAPAVSGPLVPDDIAAREARMLVSDLLEIGQQQRKAYAEAQQRAANEAAAAPQGSAP